MAARGNLTRRGTRQLCEDAGGEGDPFSYAQPEVRRHYSFHSEESFPSASASQRLDEKAVEGQHGRVLVLQFLLRLLGFLSVNMVLPTLPGYMASVGGSARDYYRCLSLTALFTVLGSIGLGAYVDGGAGRILPSYVVTAAITVVANVIYAIAGSVPCLRSPTTIMIARCLIGLGTSNSLLSMIFIGEVCGQRERQKWIVRYGLCRSQGLFWGPPLGTALAWLSTSGTGLWGADTLPGWFQAVATLVVTALLVASWQEIEEVPLPDAGSTAPGSAGGPSLSGFLRQPRVLAVLATMFCCGVAVTSNESVVPVVTQQALGWRGPDRGLPLSGMAVFLTVGQGVVLCCSERGVQDRITTITGVAGFTVVLVAALALWHLVETAREGPVEVLAPFLVMSFFAPFVMLGSFTMFSRLAMEDVPVHKGKCQALQSNVLAVTNIIAPCWLSLTYSGDLMRSQVVPQTCFAGLALAMGASLAWLLASYGHLRPVVGEASSPLLREDG